MWIANHVNKISLTLKQKKKGKLVWVCARVCVCSHVSVSLTGLMICDFSAIWAWPSGCLDLHATIWHQYVTQLHQTKPIPKSSMHNQISKPPRTFVYKRINDNNTARGLPNVFRWGATTPCCIIKVYSHHQPVSPIRPPSHTAGCRYPPDLT